MFLTNSKILLLKREATYGTDPVPTIASNALDASQITFDYQGDLLTRDILRGTLSQPQPIMGQKWAEITFTIELKGGGTKGAAARIGDALVACGLAETVSAGSSVTYAPADTGFLSCTLYFYEQQDSGNCRLHKITGARGDVSLDLNSGKFGTAQFKFQGAYNAPTEVEAPGAPTYETTLPPIIESSTLTLNSVSTLIAQAVKIAMNNDVVKQDDLNSPSGLKGFLITGRKPDGTINPESVLAATYDFYGDWAAATARALSIVVGSASGNKITITAPKLVIEKLGAGDRTGIRTEEVQFALAVNSAHDEISIRFE
jgi:hypothetical protein